MSELYQCPYENATKCRMDEPCKGCETWAQNLESRTAEGCEWESSGLISYKTECGETVLHNDDFKFCPFCGKEIKYVEPPKQEDS